MTIERDRLNECLFEYGSRVGVWRIRDLLDNHPMMRDAEPVSSTDFSAMPKNFPACGSPAASILRATGSGVLKSMQTAIIRKLYMAGAFSLAAIAGSAAAADGYPNRAIRFIDAFGAGGTTDVLARVAGQKLAERLGQHFVVDNRPGAGGNIGAEMAAKAAPDGYTLFMGVVPILAAAQSMYGRLGYDVLKDFSEITLMASGNYVLVVGPAVPAKSVRELINLAKSKPGQMRYGSSGVGSTLHLAMEMLKGMSGVDMVHVPYKGGPPMATAIAAGEVDAGTPSLTLGLPLIRAGKLIPLAVTSAQRAREFPQLPTIAEAGVPGYDITPWYAAFAPAGTPRAIVNLLNAELNHMLRLPDIQTGFAAQGLEPSGSTPQHLRQIMQSEIGKWAKVIRDANIKAE